MTSPHTQATLLPMLAGPQARLGLPLAGPQAIGQGATQARPGGLWEAVPHAAWLAPAPLAAVPFHPGGAFTGWQVDGLLGAEACQALVLALEAWAFCPTAGAYPAGYRNNDRQVVDDAAMAKALWARVQPWLPPQLEAQGQLWRAVALNPRFRACRYEGAQAFAPHRDGAHQPKDAHRSWLTLQIYLDDDFEGGRTPFLAGPQGPELMAIAPRRGRAIAFDHRAWHAGEAVRTGVKHVLRTDVMYERVGEAPDFEAQKPHQEATACSWPAHRGYVWALAPQGPGRLWSTGRDGALSLWEKQGPGPWLRRGSWALGRGSLTTLQVAGEWLLVGGRDGLVAAHSLAEGGTRRSLDQPLWTLALGSAILAMAEGPQGDWWVALASGALAALSPQGEVLWTQQGHASWARALARDAKGHMWSLGEGEQLAAWGPQGQPMGSLSLPVAGQALASRAEGGLLFGDRQGRLWAWDGQPGGGFEALLAAHAGPVLALATAPGGAWASVGEDGACHWGVDGQLQGSAHSGDFLCAVQALPDGAWAWAGYEGRIAMGGARGRLLG